MMWRLGSEPWLPERKLHVENSAASKPQLRRSVATNEFVDLSTAILYGPPTLLNSMRGGWAMHSSLLISLHSRLTILYFLKPFQRRQCTISKYFTVPISGSTRDSCSGFRYLKCCSV